jgi:exodeoxyribonuclease VII large subunit
VTRRRRPAPASDALDLFPVEVERGERRPVASREAPFFPLAPVRVPEEPASLAAISVDPYARPPEAPVPGLDEPAFAPLDDEIERGPGGIPGATPNSAVTVSTLTQTAKEVLEGAFVPLWVRGEVSDFKAHRNGHWYFCLRDQVAQVKCVIWSRDARRLPAMPDDGMEVVALGQVSVYAARGDLQLVIRRLDAQGDGLWRKALERTRARLAADGLFDPSRKRPLPRYPRRVAVVTSPDGAALHDILAVIRRRCPTVEVVVVPAKVQGDGAAEELRAAVERVSRWRMADVLIVGRGGGAREDLWAFNDERLARAIAACPIPTVSAVGHEVDLTICDLVADLRAPTPSAAAESAVPLLESMAADVETARDALVDGIGRQVAAARERLLESRGDLAAAASRVVERRQSRVETAAARLHALSPLATLARGYAVARGADGRTLARVADFAPDAPFDLLVQDGTVRATAVNTAPRHPREGGDPDVSIGPGSPLARG